MRADENAGLPVGDLVALQMRSLGDDEKLFAVHVDLWYLAAVQRVLHCQPMKAEHRFELVHLVCAWIGDPDPCEFAVFLFERLLSEGQILAVFSAKIDL